ncbi:MAG: DUF401 family protein [Lentisphaerae bacterium]|nr:DUF401 family protein [Lentisphaerota bacterium]
MPAVVKIVIVFGAMLLLTRLRVHLGLALVAGGLALNLWAGVTVPEALRNVGRALRAPDLWMMLAIVSLIVEVGRFMTSGRNAEEIVSAARRWGGRNGRAWSAMILPAVVGLVPMPAGALFSAPFVEQAGAGAEVSGDWKAAVNYWFRHVWEYWWPLYPGVIVAMSVFEMDTPQFVAAQFPFTLVAVASGYLFLVRRHVRRLAAVPGSSAGSDRRALLLLLPLAAVLVSLFALSPVIGRLLPGMPVQYRKLLAVLAGLAVAAAVILCAEPDRRRMFSTLLAPKSLSVLMSLSGVLIFKSMLDAAGLLPRAAAEMAGSGIPVFFAVAGLPLLAGLVTGIAMGFAGASFPIVVGLLAQPGAGLTPLAALALAYGFGYMGMMLSPVHLCLLVTRDYFGVPLAAVYRMILPCVAAILAYTLAAYAGMTALGW